MRVGVRESVHTRTSPFATARTHASRGDGVSICLVAHSLDCFLVCVPR